ncbi:hypothetical protein [Streptomyces sp. NPDC093094]|uniref:hypothetical protein n=1 Tax=Streptomyces sp. NPDC093094 TaxID=3366026 RepID=UPI0038227E52
MEPVRFRMLTPPALTRQAVGLLTGHSGVFNLVVVRSSQLPEGDAPECDVVRGAADGLLGRLREPGVDRTGAVAVDTANSTFSRRAEEAGAAQSPALAHAPLRAGGDARIRAAARAVRRPPT